MHLHFKDWPDHDVPEDFDPMINFCQIMRRQITTNKGLMVIHCRYYIQLIKILSFITI